MQQLRHQRTQENSHIGKSSETLIAEITKEFSFFQSLIRSGEEPYEFEFKLWSISDLLAAGLALKIPFMPYEVIYGSVRALLEYTYLYRWEAHGRRPDIGKLSGTWLTDYMNLITDNGLRCWPPFPLTISQFYALFFRYLDECGVMTMKLDTLMKVLRHFERGESAWRARQSESEPRVLQ